VAISLDRAEQVGQMPFAGGVFELGDDIRASPSGSDEFVVERQVDLSSPLGGTSSGTRTRLVLDDHRQAPAVAGMDGRNFRLAMVAISLRSALLVPEAKLPPRRQIAWFAPRRAMVVKAMAQRGAPP
jgi:hypothetical protein